MKISYTTVMLRRSLSIRILLVNIVLLILPLLLYFFLVFRSEYKDQLETTIKELTTLGESRATLFEQVMNNGYAGLTTIAELEGGLNGLNSNSNLGNDLAKYVATGGDLIRFGYFKVKGPQVILVAASDTQAIGTNYGNELYMQEAIATGHSAFLAHFPLSDEMDLIIAQTVLSEATGSPGGLLAAMILANKVLDQLTKTDYAALQARVSLITKNNIVFVSSDPSLNFVALTPLSVAQLNELQETGQFGNVIPKPSNFNFISVKGFPHAVMWKGAAGMRIGVTVPVGTTGMGIFVDSDLSALSSTLYTRFWSLILWISLAGGATTLLNLWLTHRMNRPLNQLFSVISRIGAGEYQARYEPDRLGYEINDLGSSLNQMVQSIQAYNETSQNEKVAKDLVAHELAIARDIQMRILPQETPHFEGVSLACRTLPAQEVGGDFYDLFVVTSPQDPSKKRLIISVADGAGKGISACLYSLGLRSMLRSYGAEFLPLAEVVKLANNLFCKDTQTSSMFVTTFTVAIESNAKELLYCCAGHPPALLRKKDQSIQKISRESTPLGVATIESIAEGKITLEKGDLIVLYTDGVTDAQNAKLEFYGEERFLDFIATHGDLPVEALMDDLYRDIAQFCDGYPQYDDISMVMMRIN